MSSNFFEIVDILDAFFSSNFGNDIEARLTEMAAATGQSAGKGSSAATGLVAEIEKVGQIIDGAIKQLDPLWSGTANTNFNHWLTQQNLDDKSRSDLIQHLDDAHTVLLEAAQATAKTKQACEHLITSVAIAIGECLAFSMLMGWAGPFFAESRIAIIAGQATEKANIFVRAFYMFIRGCARVFAYLSRSVQWVTRLPQLAAEWTADLIKLTKLTRVEDLVSASKANRLGAMAKFSDMSTRANVLRLASNLRIAGPASDAFMGGFKAGIGKFAMNYVGSTGFGWLAGGAAAAASGGKNPFHVSVEGLAENLLAGDIAGPLGPLMSSEARLTSSITNSFRQNMGVGLIAGGTGTALITGWYQGKPLSQVVKQTAEIGAISGIFNGSVGLAFPDSNAMLGTAIRNADEWNLKPLGGDGPLVPATELGNGAGFRLITDPTTPGYMRLPGGDHMPIVPTSEAPAWARIRAADNFGGTIARGWSKIPTFIQGNVLGFAPNMLNRRLVPFSPSEPPPHFGAADLSWPSNPAPVIGSPDIPTPTIPPAAPPTPGHPTTAPPTNLPPTTLPPGARPPTTFPPPPGSTAPPPITAPPVHTTPSNSGGYTVTVQKFGQNGYYGSLWQMADHVYGDGSKWIDIYEANRAVLGDNANYLQPGQQIYLPSLPKQASDH